MLELLYKLFGRDSINSKEIANERLRLVLVHDRAAMSPDLVEMLKEDIIAVIQKYMDVDTNGLLMSIENEENSVALIANIPIIALHRKEEETNMIPV